MPFVRASFAALALALLAGCTSSRADTESASRSPERTISEAKMPAVDEEKLRCEARVKEIEASPEMQGAPGFEANRIAILGRARGEPLVLVRAPKAKGAASLPEGLRASYATFEKERPGRRIYSLLKRHRYDKSALRTLLLREGYTYAEDPQDALAIAAHVKLTDLFDEPVIFLLRKSTVHKLTRVEAKKDTRYVHEDGPLAGTTADLDFGDRVAISRSDLDAPLHRDLASLSESLGFDRTKITRITERAMLATLRFGDLNVRAVLETEGATVRLGCIDEDKETRAAVEAFQEEQAPNLRALAAIRGAVTSLVSETMRFDRPFLEEGPDRDGHLRPVWMTAYLQGRSYFEYDGKGYPVFDTEGRAWPPEVCVDFVLDSFERAGGTWFAPKGEKLGRTTGTFAWSTDMRAVRGVLNFGDTAEKHPELFDVRRFKGTERIQFGERERFFKFLVDHADDIHPGDVVAIHGLKRDNRVHQHAIFVERTDPITGFAYGLADQMKRPRRRTWEGIMAEAPKRSLLYRVRPKDELLSQIAPEN